MLTFLTLGVKVKPKFDNGKPQYEGRDGIGVRLSIKEVLEVIRYPKKVPIREGSVISKTIFCKKRIVRPRYQFWIWSDKEMDWTDGGIHYGQV